mmetsp:Transcript_12327/g.35629  ORF Transcript_12327/g.35629 Transcript_12327/m.35629 type:complete len:325 (+) Transcript_12327:1505-2479(+)
MVLAQFQDVEDVRMPGLDVDRKGAGALAAALVYVSGRGVENSKHGDQPIGLAIRASNRTALGADLVHREANPPCGLGNSSASLECVVDPGDGVVDHVQQKAGRQLGPLCASVKQRRRGVDEPLVREEVISLKGCREVVRVDSQSHTHPHVLRPLHHSAIDSHQVRSLQSLESKVIKDKIPVVVDSTLNLRLVFLNGFHQLFIQKCTLVLVELAVPVVDLPHGFCERRRGLLVEIGDGDSGREPCIVRVLGAHVRSGLRSEVVKLHGADPRVDPLHHLLGHNSWVHKAFIQAFTELAHPRSDLVKGHWLPLAIPLRDEEGSTMTR